MSDGFLGGLESTPNEEPKSVETTPQEGSISVEEAPLQAERAALEQVAEQKDTFLEEAPTQSPVAQDAGASSAQVPEAIVESAPPDEVIVEVEKILEDGLGDFVETMPEDARQRFLSKGKEVSTKIALMVRTLKVELNNVIQLIREWLMTIPSVNRYFLEQEAKIKTDRIITLARSQKEQIQQNV